MFLLNLLTRRGKRRKRYKTEKGYSSFLEPTQKLATILEKEKRIKVLIEAYQREGDRNIFISFKDNWKALEPTDRIEILVLIEKEIAKYRNEACAELVNLYD